MVRDLNDRVYALLKDLKAPHGEFDCECDDPDCGRSVELTLEEYAAMKLLETAASCRQSTSARSRHRQRWFAPVRVLDIVAKGALCGSCGHRTTKDAHSVSAKGAARLR